MHIDILFLESNWQKKMNREESVVSVKSVGERNVIDMHEILVRKSKSIPLNWMRHTEHRLSTWIETDGKLAKNFRRLIFGLSFFFSSVFVWLPYLISFCFVQVN